MASTARASVVGLVPHDAADGLADASRPSCPWATSLAAVAALRSRRDSWPPISTPSAQPPKTTEIEPMTSAWSRSFMTVALRSVNRECSDRTSPSASGTAAQMSGTPSVFSST